VITPKHPRFAEMEKHFPKNPGVRSFIHVNVTRVSDSCGFSVPLYDFKGQRDVLDRWAEAKGPEKVQQYQSKKNRVSIDGLPALEP
jgi:hypothetical protein